MKPSNRIGLVLGIIAYSALLISCEPLVTRFDEVEEAVMYSAKYKKTSSATTDTITVMTWNIRFAAGRKTPWFGDSCGDRVILSDKEVLTTLADIAAKIEELQPDILLLQEVDVQSKRSGYIDQVQWLLDHTYFNYGAYASIWQAQYIPSDGLGRMNMGNAILSRWEIEEAERIQLPQRGDQDALTKYFYLRRNILKTRIALPGLDSFHVVNTHLEAFCTDDTKKKQVALLEEELTSLAGSGAFIIFGGDFNLLPPGSDSTDFCDEDKCPGESFHSPDDNPRHKEGSYFTPEITWLQNLYDTYQCSIPLQDYLGNQQHYFTHTPDPGAFWDRKIDYLFTNARWVPGSCITHQEIIDVSDHVPVSARWEVPK
jgi:endonuclease/exonuclease/phosphatase family metal-dependent hydrolase